MASSSGNMNEEGASDNNPGDLDLNKEKNPSSSINDDANRGCSCKKSRCVKFYCKCFNAGNLCNDSCSCENCLNNEANKDAVEEIKKKILWHDPDAFESKNVARTRNGCHCRKTDCSLQYCVCNRNGVGCTLNCRCQGCKNKYGIKGSSSSAKEQELPNGSKNVETIMDNGSSSSDSSQSHHPAVHANSSIQLPVPDNSDARADDDELGNSNNVDNIHMPVPTNLVASPYYNFLVHQNHVPETPVQIQSSRKNITEQQRTNPNWQGQSSFLRSPLYYDNNNVAELSSDPRIQQYQPHQSHGFRQQVESSLRAMTLQHPFLRSSQQPNNGDATNMQLNLHPHLHGHGPSPPPTADYEENHHHRMFLWQNNRPQ
ncbi:hypothetical protein PIB30_046718 [Stylosanthes scabra]|uniref:CRC domain-containing protein n=1 Tax=Stylosanthes scabra TaxID=79078 RepID=A0ABU6ZFA2_9FABA|nr:hypothetical protein [Stylosanthes scabra]